MSRHGGLSSALLPKIRRATSTSVSSAVMGHDQTVSRKHSVAPLRAFSSQDKHQPIPSGGSRTFTSGAAALQAYVSENSDDAAPSPPPSPSLPTLQAPREATPQLRPSSGLYMVALMVQQLPHDACPRGHRHEVVEHMESAFQDWHALSREERRRDLTSSHSVREVDSRWLQARVSVLGAALALWLLPVSPIGPHDGNAQRKAEMQRFAQFLKVALQSTSEDMVEQRAFQYVLHRATEGASGERLTQLVDAWHAAAPHSSPRDEDFWIVTLAAASRLAASNDSAHDDASNHFKVPASWLEAAARSIAPNSLAVKDASADASLPGSCFHLSCDDDFISLQLESIWKHSTLLKHTTASAAAVERRQHFLSTLSKLRLQQLTPPRNTPDSHVADTIPQSTTTTLERELKWIHASISRSIPDDRNAETYVTPLLDAWRMLHLQYTEGVTSLTLLADQGIGERLGSMVGLTTCESLTLYLNGTLLLLLGHRIEDARDGTTTLFKTVTSITNESVALLQRHQISKTVAGSEPTPKWETTILTRAHEGLRLSLKVFIKHRAFGDAAAMYERYPSMGASWELAKCYSSMSRPDDAVRIGSLFLKSTFHIFAAALKSDPGRSTSKSGRHRVLPPHITKTLLDCVEACAASRSSSAPNTERGCDPSSTESLRVTKAPLLRDQFINLVNGNPLPGIPHVHVWGRFLKGWVKGIATRSLTSAEAKGLWTEVVDAALMHAADVSSGPGRAPTPTDARACGLTRDALACVCYALQQRHLLCDDAPDCRARSLHDIVDVLSKLSDAFPRLGVWDTSLTWWLTRSGDPSLSVRLLQRLLSNGSAHNANSTMVLATLDCMSSGLLRYMEEVLGTFVSAPTNVPLGDEPFIEELRQLVATAIRQTITLNGAQASPPDHLASAADIVTSETAGWTCVYCHAEVAAERKSCNICSALRLHLWRCRNCHGFSPSTHPNDCLVCGTVRPSEGQGAPSTSRRRAETIVDASDVIPLRHWTCKFCRTTNEATHPFFCSGCKEPSRLAFQLPSTAPFDCRACGAKQLMGMLRPWCDECGTLHHMCSSPQPPLTERSNAQYSRASLWACTECAQWNPWVSFHCIDCDAAKPTALSQIREVAWQAWACNACDGHNVMWKSHCAHCQAPNSNAEGLHSQSSDNNESANYSDSHEPGIRCVVNAESSDVPAIGGAGHSEVSGCAHCGAVPLVGDDAGCRTCGTGSTMSGPILWVCLRMGCLHLNPIDQGQSDHPRCEKCSELKGLTTTISSNTNVFRYKAPDAVPAVPPSSAGSSEPSNSVEECIYDVMLRHHQQATPTAVDVWASGGEVPRGALSCANCGESLSSWNLLRLCPVCAHSCWSPQSASLPTSGDSVNELVLWLYLAATESLTTAAKQRDASRAFTLLQVCVSAFQQAHESQLPWRGRDVQNMLCAESSRNPVHEPDGTPHSAITRLSSILKAATSFGGSVARPSPQRQRQWLALALDLVELVNDSTDMDELTFDVVGQLALAIRRLGGEVAHDDDESLFLDKLRLEYLLSMKLPVGCIVGDARCRRCLCLQCQCGFGGGRLAGNANAATSFVAAGRSSGHGTDHAVSNPLPHRSPPPPCPMPGSVGTASHGRAHMRSS